MLVSYNQYESKRYFANKLAEAFRRLGKDVNIIDQDKLTQQFDPEILGNSDFSCSFNRMMIREGSKNLWDRSPIPHVSFLLDPVIYYMSDIQVPYTISTCIDRSEYAMLCQEGYRNICQFQHGVESDLKIDSDHHRPFDVVFLGSSYDPESVRSYWQAKYPPQLCKALDDAIDLVFNKPYMHFTEALKQSLMTNYVQIDEALFKVAVYLLDQYIRGFDRVELIRSIKESEVHVFGGTGWRDKIPIAGWDRYLAEQPNVTIHPEISFRESIEVLKQSKIALNSMPFFPNGSHERVFYALACGALPLTTDNLYYQDSFVAGKEIEFYHYQKRGEVNNIVLAYLGDEKARQQIVEQGREKVMREHTWDKRAEKLLQDLPPLLNMVKELLPARKGG